MKEDCSAQAVAPVKSSKCAGQKKGRSGKKRRILIRRRIEAQAGIISAASAIEAEKVAADKEKRTRKNREKKVKKKQKDKLKKAQSME